MRANVLRRFVGAEIGHIGNSSRRFVKPEMNNEPFENADSKESELQLTANDLNSPGIPKEEDESSNSEERSFFKRRLSEDGPISVKSMKMEEPANLMRIKKEKPFDGILLKSQG